MHALKPILGLKDAWDTVSRALGPDWQGHSFALLGVRNFYPPMHPSIREAEIYRDAVFLVGRGIFHAFNACLAEQEGVYSLREGTFGLWGPNPRRALVGDGLTLLQGSWARLPEALNKIHPSQWDEFQNAYRRASIEWLQGVIPTVLILRE